MATVFYLFRDAPQRRRRSRSSRASRRATCCAAWISSRERGYAVGHNLERSGPPPLGADRGRRAEAGLERAGGYGGDFATVLSSLRRLNRADVVFSTVDTVGIPLMLLARSRAVRSPFVYAAIGLPERLEQLRSKRMERLYAKRSARRPRSSRTAGTRRTRSSGWLRERGVDVQRRVRALRRRRRRVRARERAADVDVVSIGADPHRDFELLLAVARTLPRRAFSSSRRPSARARSPRGRRTSPSRPTCPSTRCAAGSSVRAWSLCRYATTATRVRRPCSSRRWRSQGRSSSLEPRRSRRVTGSSTGATRCSSPRGTRRAFGLAVGSCSTTSREQERSDCGRGRPRRRRSRGSASSIGSKHSSQRPRRRSRVERRTAGYRLGRALAGGRSCGARARPRARARPSEGRPVRRERPGSLSQRRGTDARRRPPVRGRLRQQGSALLLHVCRRLLDRRLARPVPARRDLARARRGRRRAAGSSARSAEVGGGRELLRLSPDAGRRLVPRRPFDARGVRRRPARPVALAPQAVRRGRRRRRSRAAPQAQPRAARSGTARRAARARGARLGLGSAPSPAGSSGWVERSRRLRRSSPLRGELGGYLGAIATTSTTRARARPPTDPSVARASI